MQAEQNKENYQFLKELVSGTDPGLHRVGARFRMLKVADVVMCSCISLMNPQMARGPGPTKRPWKL